MFITHTLVVTRCGGAKWHGTTPTDSLFIDTEGNLLGTTKSGGANSLGTVFEIPVSGGAFGSASTVVSFNSQTGSRPDARLIADAAGNLFGTTHAVLWRKRKNIGLEMETGRPYINLRRRSDVTCGAGRRSP